MAHLLKQHQRFFVDDLSAIALAIKLRNQPQVPKQDGLLFPETSRAAERDRLGMGLDRVVELTLILGEGSDLLQHVHLLLFVEERFGLLQGSLEAYDLQKREGKKKDKKVRGSLTFSGRTEDPEGVYAGLVPVIRKPKPKLHLTIASARNLRQADTFGKSDPSVEVYLNNEKVDATATIKNTLNPPWLKIIVITVATSVDLKFFGPNIASLNPI